MKQHNTILKTLLPIAGAILLTTASNAAVIAGYSFGTNLSPTSTSPTGISGVTAIGSGSGITGISSSQGYTTARGYGSGVAGDTVATRSTSGSGGTNGSFFVRAAGGDGLTLTTAINGGQTITTPNSSTFSSSANDYFGFSLTVDSGFQLSLSSMTFDAALNSATVNPNQVSLLISPTGFTSSDSLGDRTITTVTTTGAYQDFNIDLSAVSGLQNLAAGTYEARFYVYGGTVSANSNDPTRFDNIVLNGTVIPEPTTAVLAGAFGILGLLRRRRA